MTSAESLEFQRIKRGMKYGVTMKELAWLIGLVDRLDKLSCAPQPEPDGGAIERAPVTKRKKKH